MMTQLTIKGVSREISTFYIVWECVCVVLVVAFCSDLWMRAKLAWVREISFHALSLKFFSPYVDTYGTPYWITQNAQWCQLGIIQIIILHYFLYQNHQ